VIWLVKHWQLGGTEKLNLESLTLGPPRPSVNLGKCLARYWEMFLSSGRTLVASSMRLDQLGGGTAVEFVPPWDMARLDSAWDMAWPDREWDMAWWDRACRDRALWDVARRDRAWDMAWPDREWDMSWWDRARRDRALWDVARRNRAVWFMTRPGVLLDLAGRGLAVRNIARRGWAVRDKARPGAWDMAWRGWAVRGMAGPNRAWNMDWQGRADCVMTRPGMDLVWRDWAVRDMARPDKAVSDTAWRVEIFAVYPKVNTGTCLAQTTSGMAPGPYKNIGTHE
jgi:hypothetical protein